MGTNHWPNFVKRDIFRERYYMQRYLREILLKCTPIFIYRIYFLGVETLLCRDLYHFNLTTIFEYFQIDKSSRLTLICQFQSQRVHPEPFLTFDYRGQSKQDMVNTQNIHFLSECHQSNFCAS